MSLYFGSGFSENQRRISVGETALALLATGSERARFACAEAVWGESRRPSSGRSTTSQRNGARIFTEPSPTLARQLHKRRIVGGILGIFGVNVVVTSLVRLVRLLAQDRQGDAHDRGRRDHQAGHLVPYSGRAVQQNQV